MAFLATECGYTPDEIRAVTLPEIELLAEGWSRRQKRTRAAERHPHQSVWWPEGAPDEEAARLEDLEAEQVARAAGLL